MQLNMDAEMFGDWLEGECTNDAGDKKCNKGNVSVVRIVHIQSHASCIV